MTDLSELLERCRKATGPNPKLDQAIDEWLYRTGGKHHGEMEYLPSFTASVDAALALVERLLPGWTLRLHIHPNAAYADLYRLGDLTHFPQGKIERRVTSPYYEGLRLNDNFAPLAILDALLQAIGEQP